MAPYWIARRVIPRMTDSVKCAALLEIGFLNVSVRGLGHRWTGRRRPHSHTKSLDGPLQTRNQKVERHRIARQFGCNGTHDFLPHSDGFEKNLGILTAVGR